MRIAFFDTHGFEKTAFDGANASLQRPHQIAYMEPRLTAESVIMARGYEAVCAFANCKVSGPVLESLAAGGTRLVLLRSAGFNHCDVAAASRLGLKVARVPEYSPYAVAEHAVALLLTLNRKIHRAHARVHEMNFSLDGLVGFDLHGKTCGVIGTGRIGRAAARIFTGFGCRVLAHDPSEDPGLKALGVQYVPLIDIYGQCDVITLHVPLTPQTLHMIDHKALSLMKPSVYLVNTGRGRLIDTPALVHALKAKRVGGAALDVYEEEEGVFFNDLSQQGLQDDQLARLLTFPNVLITSHQGFLTHEALSGIATTTLANASDFEAGKALVNEVVVSPG